MISLTDFTTRLALALLLGAAIGMERQWRQRMAGLRTNTLVALGAAIFITLSVKISGEATGRVASYIVSGIGFLGAGVIMKNGPNVQGLNTAATLWCSGAIGSLAGLGFFEEAIIATAFIVSAHLILRPIGLKMGEYTHFKKLENEYHYYYTIRCKQEVENHVRVLIMRHLGNNENILLKSLNSDDNGTPENAIIHAEITANSPLDTILEKIAARLTIEKGVTQVKWEYINE